VGSGSDRLVDAIVAWGDMNAVIDRIRAHQSAGADHVCLPGPSTGPTSAANATVARTCIRATEIQMR
jgi:2-methylisocitrate lyase-like PEP mutase family enzyme